MVCHDVHCSIFDGYRGNAKMKAWYFSTTERKLRYGDDRSIELGITHSVEGKLKVCEKGLHGSERLIDALSYAPGPVIWEVELSGEIVTDDGTKHCASSRTYLRGGVDISEVLRKFARRVALDVAQYWDMPGVVREYLETGDKSKQSASAAAAYAAANAAHAASANANANAAAYASANAANAAAYAAANAAYAAAAANANAANAAADAAADAANSANSAKDKYNIWLTEMVEEELKP